MAEAILLQDVEHLGERGQAVEVSPGYLRNYLVPRKLAQPATKGALEEAARRREVAERTEREQAERAQESAALLSKTVLTIHHRAGEDGKLFGSVGAKEISDAIREARDLKIDRRKVKLEQPIHETGTYMVDVDIGGGVTASVKTIVAEEK
jgi:large subunit ribosomal protein L9